MGYHCSCRDILKREVSKAQSYDAYEKACIALRSYDVNGCSCAAEYYSNEQDMYESEEDSKRLLLLSE